MRYMIQANRVLVDAGLGFHALGQNFFQYRRTPYAPWDQRPGACGPQYRTTGCNVRREVTKAHVQQPQQWPPYSPCQPWPRPGTTYWGPPNEPPSRPCAYSCG